MNGFIRSASYLRVSSQHQADEHTIDSQCADVRARATRDLCPIDPAFEYIDDGYSGSQLLRPAMERLRDHVAASMIDRLYIHSPDRLARKFAHQAILLEEMDKHGCQVIFLNQDGLPDSPETKMLIQMQGMFAEYEREKILERTRRGRRHSAARGKVSVFGRAPFGYRYIRRSECEPEARWEIDPIESKTVQMMFELVGQHGKSLGGVCRELKHLGIRTKTGKLNWDRATVRGMLTNSAYCGEARYGKTRFSPRNTTKRAKRGDPPLPRNDKVAVATDSAEQIMISVPALISKSLFEEVRKRMEDNRKRQRQHQAGTNYLLSGLLICGECGSAYCHQGGNRHHYYRCIGTDTYRRRGNTICDNKSVKALELESSVWSNVCDLLREPDRLQEELHRRHCESPSSSSAITKQQLRVDDLRGRLDRMIDAYSQGLIEREEFESRIGSLRDQHDREAATLVSLRGDQLSSSGTDTAVAQFREFASEIEHSLSTASESFKRELLRVLIERIEICRNEIRIVYKVPPNPFVPSPANRGFFQHWLSLRQTPSA